MVAFILLTNFGVLALHKQKKIDQMNSYNVRYKQIGITLSHFHKTRAVAKKIEVKMVCLPSDQQKKSQKNRTFQFFD